MGLKVQDLVSGIGFSGSDQKDLLLRMNGAKRVQIYKAAVNQDDAILIHTDAQPKSKLPLPVWVLMSHPMKSIAK